MKSITHYSSTGRLMVAAPSNQKTSLAFATIFLTIATLACVGSAVMLWHAWHSLRVSSTSETAPASIVASEAKTERLSAAAQLAATIRNSSNGTATSKTRTDSTANADQRATAWFDSTMR